MRTQLKNSGSALLYQLVVVIVGLVIPRIMIQSFGSETYGLGSSVGQFLSYITLIEGGIGGVARAALYKAFANKTEDKVSGVLGATSRYFKKVAAIFVGYVLVLAFVYPRITDVSFDAFFTGSLVCIIAISSLAQYCFGVTYSILLQADQRGYVTNTVNIITYLLNAALTVTLVSLGASFHVVKLVSACVFVIRPLALNIYVRKKYNIDRRAPRDDGALKQKWSGMAHHVAWFLHTNTDVVVITLLCSLKDVSIYSVYFVVASSMTKLATSFVNGVEAKFGKMMALEGEEKAQDKFVFYTMFMNSMVIILFTTAAGMLMPFVTLYTQDITDANYYIPLLGYMLLLAEALYCVRIPYHNIVTAAGHFKQTQTSAILEAAINIVFSVVLVLKIGLPGVAIATAGAMLYRTVYYIFYLSKNILKIGLAENFVRVAGAFLVCVLTVLMKSTLVKLDAENYLQWLLQAVGMGLVAIGACAVYNCVLYRPQLRELLAGLRRKKK